ncbi:MAG: hypothetical protein ACE5I0_10780 [Candidatus Binatia bacterium]
MKSTRLIQPVMLLAGILGVAAFSMWVGGVFSKVIESPGSNYCQIQFPAIREETLYTNRPVLKDWSEGDIVDFVGPCGHNPLGKDEIEAQRAELRRDLREDIPDDCGIFGEVRGYWGPHTICDELS